MALSIFEDRAEPPGSADLDGALGRTGALWDELIRDVEGRLGGIDREWAFAGPAFGWSLRLVRQKRRIVYLIPQSGRFLAGVVLGEKAVAAAIAGDLPDTVLEVLNSAPKHAEGRGIRLAVGSHEDLEAVKLLVSLKISG